MESSIARPRPRLRLRSLPLLPLLLLLCLLCLLCGAAPALGAPDLYCGDSDCYALLGLRVEDAPSARDIKKAFYKLSLQLHPDKLNASAAADPAVAERFRAVANAYEVLSDDESRKAYDDMLAHPEQFWQHRMRYYQHRYKYARQTDATLVCALTLLLASVVHWMYWNHRYRQLRAAIAASPLVLARMRQKVKADLVAEKIKAGQKNPTVSKDELDAGVAKEDVSSYAELSSWEGRPPTWKDALPVWLLLAPWRLARGLYWYVRFFVLFGLLRREYGEEEAHYATASALGMSWHKWMAAVPADTRTQLLSRKLWLPKNMEAWRREMMQAKKKTW